MEKRPISRSGVSNYALAKPDYVITLFAAYITAQHVSNAWIEREQQTGPV